MPSSSISEVATAIVLHQLLMRIELDRHPFLMLGLTICLSLVPSLISQVITKENIAIIRLFSWPVSFRILIYLSLNIFAYRAFFHPLFQFPGPFVAKLSKFWSVTKVAQSQIRWYKVLDKLHTEYGDVVRVGPRELVFFNTEAIAPILGPSSKATRGTFYGALEPSVLSTRSQSLHKQRRRIWDLALKTTLTGFSSTIEDFTDTLLTRIENHTRQKVRLNELCTHYAFDVMSAVGFGESARFLEGEESPASRKMARKVQEHIVAVGPLSHVPWLLTALRSLRPKPRMMIEVVEQRRCSGLASGNEKPDILGCLVENTDDTEEGRELLYGDARIIHSAGSDTTATALTVIFVLLACHPEYQTQLREAMKTSFADDSYTCTTPHALLDGIINEALRLYPPVTFSPQRVTPSEGIHIGSVLIPGDTIVSVAMWTLHHDPRNFVHSQQFIPERWSSKPQLILNKAALIPFSSGPYNCPGKSLAMMELRSVVARTIDRYEVRIAEEGFDENLFFDGVKDHFTAGVPGCEVVFKAWRA